MTGCSTPCQRRPSSPSPSPSPEPASPLEDDDLLHEIFLRLPPQPPYLMRASIVSNRWRRLATDRKFLRRFRIHHRNPPLLGDFSVEEGSISFRSTIDPPYRIPADQFPLRVALPWGLVNIRHGRVLIINRDEHQLIVWDPITGDRSLVAIPREFGNRTTGAVLCAAGDLGHVHGACHSSPFKVALLSCYEQDGQQFAFASVYSPETGIWSDILSTQIPYCSNFLPFCSTLVGNTLHWWLMMNGNILGFDLDILTLAVIKGPPDFPRTISVEIIQAEDGGVGLAALSWPFFHQQPRFQIWERNVNCNGVAVWVLRKSIELQKLLGLWSKIDMRRRARIVRYAEDLHAIFVWADPSLFMVQLKTMQSKVVFKSEYLGSYHPFTSFYAEGILE